MNSKTQQIQKMISDERTAILEDEVLILRDSGEIPEIAYHSALYYLSQDPEGPTLNLTQQEIGALQDAALSRYQEIVLRDIDPANRDSPSYRGIRRTIYNWHRLQDFCSRINRDCTLFREKVRRLLLIFLQQEIQDVTTCKRKSSVNCTINMLESFLRELEVFEKNLPSLWKSLCHVEFDDTNS